jgi:hypothetical protein
MISQEQLDRIVLRWQIGESFHRGYVCEPQLTEFDKGWVVWAPYPAGAPMTEPGGGKTVIIDAETGEITVIPGVPPSVARQMYVPRREQADTRLLPPAVMDPPPFTRPALPWEQRERRSVLNEAELARYTGGSHVALPQIAAELTVGGQTFVAIGHTADTTPALHPLVWQALNSIAPGNRNRGADRQPELVALSKGLTAHFGAGQADLAQVRAWLGGAALRLRAFNEGSDPDEENKAYSCHTSRAVLIALGLPGNPPPDLIAPPLPAKETGDLTFLQGLVSQELTALVMAPGLRHSLPILPFLPSVLAPYGHGYSVMQSAPGAVQRVETFTIGAGVPGQVADTLGDCSARLGARLFPVGEEGAARPSIIAIDEHERVFALDHTGLWFLGASLDDAVHTLLTGGATPRVREDGSW